MKYLWDNPYTGRTWCQCGACQGVVSRKSETCKHCGAHFLNMKNGKLRITGSVVEEDEQL